MNMEGAPKATKDMIDKIEPLKMIDYRELVIEIVLGTGSFGSVSLVIVVLLSASNPQRPNTEVVMLP